MCGFIGIVGKKITNLDIESLVETIKSRGVDDYGIVSNSQVTLIHTRLSIMDCSFDSAQPMNFKNLSMIFNGAIYNYQEIKDDLIASGYEFDSKVGDSEVLLKGFHKYREKILDKLNGMFSFAIFDRERDEIFLARDRFGIKPLYYGFERDSFIFGSTLQSILKFNIDKSINTKALHNYMSFHSAVPSPNTIINGVEKLEQGCYAIYNLKTKELSKPTKYWNLKIDRSNILSYDEYKSILKEKLIKAVERRLVADVDVGVLLSGGIDSSLLVAIAREFKENLNTYSIGFNSTKEERGDEFFYSDIIADRFQTNHHKIRIDDSRVLRELRNAISSMSEPMISHDVIGFYLISKEVSRSIKVVQSGQGADEVFGGYHWYEKIAKYEGNIEDAYRSLFFDRTHNEMKKVLNSKFLSDDFSSEVIKNYFKDKNFSNIDSSMHIDTNLFLVDDPVKRVDNMTMAFSLEARVPFLDHELVEFAFSIPPEYRYKDGGKKILKDISRDFLPREVIDREKGYFPMPMLKYISGEYLEFIRDAIDSKRARERNIFNLKEVDLMLKKPNEQITNLRINSLWQIALLELWLAENNL